MVHMRQPFFSIATSIIFSLLGLVYGIDAIHNNAVVIAGAEVSPSALWTIAGTMFLMAYFALVHLHD